MFYLDIPLIHHRTKLGAEFIEVCATTKLDEIFLTFPVQALINCHWAHMKY